MKWSVSQAVFLAIMPLHYRVFQKSTHEPLVKFLSGKTDGMGLREFFLRWCERKKHEAQYVQVAVRSIESFRTTVV